MIRTTQAARILSAWPTDVDAIEAAIVLSLQARRFAYQAAA